MKDALGSVRSLLVLGGGSDIGHATALEFVRRGCQRVVLAGRDSQRLRDHADELRASGADVEAVAFDARDMDDHEQFVADTFKRFGDLDVVLLAFGVLGDTDRDLADGARALDVIRTNYVGAVSVMIPVADKLEEQGHGTLVILSSVAAVRPRKSNFVYGSSKAGLDWFAQGLGDRLHGSGVHVMVVRPGFVPTKMTEGMQAAPLAATADEVATAICDGLAEGREIVWVPARMRWVMAGLGHLPRALFRRLPI